MRVGGIYASYPALALRAMGHFSLKIARGNFLPFKGPIALSALRCSLARSILFGGPQSM